MEINRSCNKKQFFYIIGIIGGIISILLTISLLIFCYLNNKFIINETNKHKDVKIINRIKNNKFVKYLHLVLKRINIILT